MIKDVNRFHAQLISTHLESYFLAKFAEQEDRSLWMVYDPFASKMVGVFYEQEMAEKFAALLNVQERLQGVSCVVSKTNNR